MTAQTALKLQPQTDSIIDVIIEEMQAARVVKAFERDRKFSATAIAYHTLGSTIHAENLAILDELAALDA